MSTLLNFGRDVQGMNAYAPQLPKDIYTATLIANTSVDIGVPPSSDVWIMYVRVQPSGWVWCSSEGTANPPIDNTLNESISELIVGTVEYKRTVYKGSNISFLTTNETCDIEVSFYQISYP